MQGLNTLQYRQEAPLRHTTSSTNTTHLVATVLGEFSFDPLQHNYTITSGHMHGRVHKA